MRPPNSARCQAEVAAWRTAHVRDDVVRKFGPAQTRSLTRSDSGRGGKAEAVPLVPCRERVRKFQRPKCREFSDSRECILRIGAKQERWPQMRCKPVGKAAQRIVCELKWGRCDSQRSRRN